MFKNYNVKEKKCKYMKIVQVKYGNSFESGKIFKKLSEP